MMSSRAINGIRNKLGVSRVSIADLRAFAERGFLDNPPPNFGKRTAEEIRSIISQHPS